MRLLPNGFHHVLRQILRRRRRKTQAYKLCLHARPKMIKQNRKRPSVTLRADGREQIVKLSLQSHRTACGGAPVDLSAVGQTHKNPPTP
jgi:hypothetical protein